MYICLQSPVFIQRPVAPTNPRMPSHLTVDVLKLTYECSKFQNISREWEEIVGFWHYNKIRECLQSSV